MIRKEDFTSEFSSDKIESLIENNPRPFYYKEAFRVIKHSKDVKMEEKDFYPSIMEYNNPPYTMPNLEKQNRKQKTELYGVSCFDSIDHLNAFVQTVTSFREGFENSGWHVAKGFVNKDFGFADEAEKTGQRAGHFNYYLFDPINKNPVKDFKESEQDEHD